MFRMGSSALSGAGGRESHRSSLKNRASGEEEFCLSENKGGGASPLRRLVMVAEAEGSQASPKNAAGTWGEGKVLPSLA